MQRQILLTEDGSHTISIPGLQVSYHSKYGALQESMHVFIEPGLKPLLQDAPATGIDVLEIGFGTGLNTLLTWRTAAEFGKQVRFVSIEAYPLTTSEWHALNHGKLLSMQPAFEKLHQAAWETNVNLDKFFTLEKRKISLLDFQTDSRFDCIYFDAFDPLTQPEMWTQAVFEKLYACCKPGARLLTYCSKSIVRHAMTGAGFKVTKIPGPRGKREMVVAEAPREGTAL